MIATAAYHDARLLVQKSTTSVNSALIQEYGTDPFVM